MLRSARFGGTPLAALLAFAWVANPFTQYVSSSNTNDAIMPTFLIWGFWAPRRSVAAPSPRSGPGRSSRRSCGPTLGDLPERTGLAARNVFAVAFALVTAVSFWALVLGGDPVDSFRVFYERTFEIQLDRRSPFSPWDWGQYHARGIPDLGWLQSVLQIVLAVAALAVAIVPRRKSPLQLAALSAALLMAFELVLTHWAALYIAWFFPFLALAIIAGPELGGVVSTAQPPASAATGVRSARFGATPELRPARGVLHGAGPGIDQEWNVGPRSPEPGIHSLPDPAEPLPC